MTESTVKTWFEYIHSNVQNLVIRLKGPLWSQSQPCLTAYVVRWIRCTFEPHKTTKKEVDTIPNGLDLPWSRRKRAHAMKCLSNSRAAVEKRKGNVVASVRLCSALAKFPKNWWVLRYSIQRPETSDQSTTTWNRSEVPGTAGKLFQHSIDNRQGDTGEKMEKRPTVTLYLNE